MSSTAIPDSEMKGAAPENHIGFADFAKFIASDQELSLYKGFGDMSARNLLYLQAEQQYITVELAQYDKEDRETFQTSQDEKVKHDIERSARTWGGILKQSEEGEPRAVRRLEMIKELRKLTKEYDPEPRTKSAFMNWFRHTKPLRGAGWHLLDDENDLIALKKIEPPDRLTTLIQFCFGYRLRDETREPTPKSWGPMYYYKDRIIARIVAVIAVVMTAAFLIGAIVGLYFVSNAASMLGIVTLFTVSFAAAVGLLTNAKRVEIFAATAA